VGTSTSTGAVSSTAEPAKPIFTLVPRLAAMGHTGWWPAEIADAQAIEIIGACRG